MLLICLTVWNLKCKPCLYCWIICSLWYFLFIHLANTYLLIKLLIKTPPPDQTSPPRSCTFLCSFWFKQQQQKPLWKTCLKVSIATPISSSTLSSQAFFLHYPHAIFEIQCRMCIVFTSYDTVDCSFLGSSFGFQVTTFSCISFHLLVTPVLSPVFSSQPLNVRVSQGSVLAHLLFLGILSPKAFFYPKPL